MANDVDIVIAPKTHDLGGFEVHRVLPSIQRRMVGPFIFFDHMGPAAFPAGKGIDVRPHPHIGLATVTYLFEGEILHRDNLGSVQAIKPGAVNWMTAGRGIAHSERTPPEIRKAPARLHGIQLWVALPTRHEEIAPSFVHHGGETLPVINEPGKTVRVIAGSIYGSRSPVTTLSDMVYADATLAAGVRLPIPADFAERAIYVATGSIAIDGTPYATGQLLVLKPGAEVIVQAESESHVLILGGEPMDGPRHIWWNFVSSSKDRIEQAKADWKAGRFPTVTGETEFIPLPE